MPKHVTLLQGTQRAFRGGALTVLGAVAILFLVAVGLFPGITLRPVDGSTKSTEIAALVASVPGSLVGLVLLGYSYRGFEEMRFVADGVVVPVRSPSRMIRGLQQVLRFADLDAVHLLVNTKGIPIVEFRLPPTVGKARVLRFATGWSSNPDQFIETLSAHVQVSKVVGWEQLWFEWRSTAKRQ